MKGVSPVACLAACILGAAAQACAAPGDAGFDRARADLIAELREQGISDERVLDAIDRAPRHEFVPERSRALAYRNHPLPIGYGQTISQPYIVALMTEIALGGRPDSGMRVLEIGTGSGYQAAVLAHVFKDVYTIEIVPELSKTAEARLKKMRYDNIVVRTGDGYKGWPGRAPFDAIVVTASPPFIPQALVDQIAVGGRMVLPVGRESENQWLVLVEKSDTGAANFRPVIPVRFVPMVPGDPAWRELPIPAVE